MADLLAEAWWPLSLAVAIAAVLAVGHRVCANLAFEASYQRGFFTQGTLFGLFAGFPGVLFVGTWRHLDSPNAVNQHQLQLAADDGEARWHGGLGQVTTGLGLFWYQLVATVFLHRPELGSVWFWLAAVALVITGCYRFLGAFPPFSLMPPLKSDGVDDVPELLDFVTKRHAWGLVHGRQLMAGQFAVAGLCAAGVGLVVLNVLWATIPPFNIWLGTAVCLAVIAVGTAAWFLLRRWEADLAWEGDQLIIKSATEPQVRELYRVQLPFFSDIQRFHFFVRYRLAVVFTGWAPLVAAVMIALLTERPFMYWVAGAEVVVLVLLGLGIRRQMAELEELGEGMEQREARMIELIREAEAAAIAKAREQSREEVGEVYNFELGSLVGRGPGLAEYQYLQQQRDHLEPGDREALDRDEADRVRGYLDAAAREQEYLNRLDNGRRSAAVTGVLVLVLRVGLELIGFHPFVGEPLKYTALACFVLALATFLPEKFIGLRDPGCLGVTGKLSSFAVAAMVLWAIFAGYPAD